MNTNTINKRYQAAVNAVAYTGSFTDHLPILLYVAQNEYSGYVAVAGTGFAISWNDFLEECEDSIQLDHNKTISLR